MARPRVRRKNERAMEDGKGFTPEIRFGEFGGADGSGGGGAWKKMRAGYLMSLTSGQHLGPDQYEIDGIGLPYLAGPSDINNTDKTTRIDGKLVKTGDTLITVKGSSAGNTVFYDGPSAVIGRQLMAASANAKIEKYFLSIQLQTQQWKLQQLSLGNMIPGLSRGDILTLKLHLPTLPEQRKIAAFLGLVDRRLGLARRRVAVLKEWKRGVMERVFGAGEIEQWPTKNLGELFEFVHSNSLSRAKLHESGIALNIHYGDIHKGLGDTIDLSLINLSYITEEYSKITYLEPGDLLIADASEDYADIGRSTEVLQTNGKLAVAGLHTIVLRNDQDFATGFKSYLFRSDYMRKQIMRIATGVSVLGISKTELQKLDVPVPSIATQTRIANILSAVDRRLTLAEGEVALWGAWKRGLLGGMLG